MAISNFSFAGLAMAGHSNWGMAGAIGFENFASGIGGVCVVAYLSALADLRFTATHFALFSAAASILGRFVTGTSAGRLIEVFGYVDFYIDRKSVEEGPSVSVRVDLGGLRLINKKST